MRENSLFTFFQQNDTKVLSTPVMVGNGAIVSVDSSGFILGIEMLFYCQAFQSNVRITKGQNDIRVMLGFGGTD